MRNSDLLAVKDRIITLYHLKGTKRHITERFCYLNVMCFYNFYILIHRFIPQLIFKPHIKTPQPLIFKGFMALFCLLKLNRPRRLTCYIIEYPIYMVYLIDNSVGHLFKYFPRESCRFGCHKVYCFYGAEGYGVVIGPVITHYSYASHIGEGCKVLVDFL